jgi:hypothetical protein
MTKDNNAALESEIDQIRERLAGTIDELVYRAHPKTIAGRRVAAIKAVYVDPATGELHASAIAKTVAIAGGVIGAMVLLRKITR